MKINSRSSKWYLVVYITLSLACYLIAGAEGGSRLDLRGMSRMELDFDAFIVKGDLKFPAKWLPKYWELIDEEDKLLDRCKMLDSMKNLFTNQNGIGFYLTQLHLLAEKHKEIGSSWDSIGLEGNGDDARELAKVYEVLAEEAKKTAGF